jgi:hypothetical protein
MVNENIIKERNARYVPLYTRYLFPRCSVKIPAQLSGGYVLKKGDIVIVHTPRPFPFNFYSSSRIATESEVMSVFTDDGNIIAEVKGLRRVLISIKNEFGEAYYTDLPDHPDIKDDDVTERLRKKAQEFVFLVNVSESDRLIYLMGFMNGIHEITDFVSHYFIIDRKKSGVLYRETNSYKRAALLELYISNTIKRINKSAGRKA